MHQADAQMRSSDIQRLAEEEYIHYSGIEDTLSMKQKCAERGEIIQGTE